jgi:E3 ubiquitin-protein ligase RNF5
VKPEPVASIPDVRAAVSDSCNEENSAFECNICLDIAKEPVVTLCGHLYCWPCLYRWMQHQTHSKACPVCKAGIQEDKVIPIYGRGSESTSSQHDPKKAEPLPPRPAGQRTSISQAPSSTHQQPGVLPALFGFQLGPGHVSSRPPVQASTPDQQHQAFLSRLLLMLGSFVIMCLLVF